MRFVVPLFFLLSCQSPMRRDSGLRNAQRHLKSPHVILISIDGYRHDYTKKYAPPNLGKFIEKGIQADGLAPIYPSKTFPNHYSIVTGLKSETHGIVANSFWDATRNKFYQMGNTAVTRDGSWYGGEPLWVAAAKQDMLSASYFWVGSDASIQGIHPTYWYPYDGRVPNHERVKQVLRWLEYPEKKRPRLITLYFSDVDRAGHQGGPDGSDVRNAIMRVDKHIGHLIKGVEKIQAKHKISVNIVIASDHGMQKIDKDKSIYLTDYISLNPQIRVVGQGSHLLLYIPNPKLRDKTYRELAKASDKLQVYKRGELPAKYGYNDSQRIGDLVITARPPHYIYLTRPLMGGPGRSGGTHGYNPYHHKSMYGIFYARGPQVRNAGRIPAFKNIHIYPFIMDILGLKIDTKIDGDLRVLAPYIIKDKSVVTPWDESA